MLSTWGCATFPKPTLDLQFAGATSLDSRVTFTRGSQATLFDSTGTLVYAKHNLLLRSGDFGNIAWTKVRASISSDQVIAPDGTLTADLGIEDNTASNTHNPALQDVTISANATYTASGYFKALTRFRGSLQFSSIDSVNFVSANFNLTAGTVTATSGGTGSGATAAIADVGNGWYRVTISGAIGGGLTTGRWIFRLADSNGNTVYTGDGTSGLYLWGGQLNLSNMEGGVTSSLDTYYPTTTAAYYGPRFDYDPSTLAARGLLIEEARTNSIRNNTMQGAVAGTPGTLPTNWSVPTTAGLTTNVIGTGTSGGITYIDLQVTGTTSGTSYILIPEAATQIAALNGQTWAMSAWWSIVSGDFTNVTAANFDIRELDAGGVQLASGAISVSLPTATFTRINGTRTNTNASTAFVQPRFRFTVNNTSAVNFTLRIGLPQLELGAFATSVIPTTTTALTRNADVASMTGTNFSSWYNQSAGTFLTVYSLARPSSGLNQFTVRSSDNTYNNAIAMNTTNTGFPQISTASGGVFDGTASAVSALTANVAVRFIGCYATNDVAVSLNGAAVVTDTSATIPTALTRLDIGSDHAGVNRIQGGYIQRISYYPSRLPDGTLQALTA